MISSIVPRPVPAGTPLTRPILAWHRETGEPLALVPSASEPNKYHVTTLTRCDCKGFTYCGKCRHVVTVQAERGIADGGSAHLQVLRAAGSWPTKPVEPCGICDQVHRCHCSRVKSWCDRCPPLGGGR